MINEDTGCKHFHPYLCGRLSQCPKNCSRKSTFEDYENNWDFDNEKESLEDKNN